MRAMKGKNENHRLGLEILTPVQTGSGSELSRNLDYIDRNGAVFVVDQEQTFAAIASGDQSLDETLSNAKLGDLVKLAGRHYGYTLPPMQGSANVIPDRFREQIKDAFLNPYIPGTALKGAIRTALMAKVLRQYPVSDYQHLLPREGQAKLAANKLSKEIFGKDPNADLLRALHVGDAIFQDMDLRLADIRWLNLTGKVPHQARWRDMPSRSSKDRWQDAMGLYAEALAPQAIAAFTLQWDRFLLSSLDWHSKNPIPGLLPENFGELCESLNDHARYRLQLESRFYGSYGQSKPKDECERILKLIEQEPHAAYLQLSWGSGWGGMTGSWMNDDIKGKMRNLFRPMEGRSGMPFPKTRRLAVKENYPSLPLGWVRLIPLASVQARLDQKAALQQQQARRCEWVDDKIQQIMSQNRSREDEVLRGKTLAESWSKIEDASLKSAALADIKSRWQGHGWWDQPPSGAAKKTRPIYGENE